MKLCPKQKERMKSSLGQLVKLLFKFQLLDQPAIFPERRQSMIRRSIEARQKGRFK